MNQKASYPVTGMNCAACAARVDKTLRRQAGVTSAGVNFATGMATVEYDTALTSPEALQQAVRAAGYDLIITPQKPTPEELEQRHHEKLRSLRRRTLCALALALPVAVIAMCFPDMPHANLIMCLLATPVVFGLGSSFFRSAWQQLRHRSANMDTLVAVSTSIAYLFSLFNLLFPDFWLSRGIQPHVYFESSSVIIAFILLGRTLEERAKGDTTSAIRRLMGLQPRNVTRLSRSGATETIPVEAICAGDILLVKPGERVPADGEVTEGSSFVDESMLSGEPLAVDKQPGSKVWTGTINQRGSLRIRAEQVGTETLLSKIIRQVEEAQGSKAPVQRLADKVAAIFVPTVMALALLSFVLWIALGGTEGFIHGLLAAVTVLIVACPCALGLATPTAIMVGIGKGAERGILIKDAESLETARQIDTVVVDKTGTVTEGKPAVTALHLRADSDARAADIFCSLERLSEHPLAEAITRHLPDASSLEVSAFASLTGRGVRGIIEGKTYFAGNQQLMEENAICLSPDLLREAQQMEAAAQTVVWLADEHETLAVVGITDRVKESSIRAVRQLRERGVEVYMLTGDQAPAAREVARQAGITHFRAGMLPQDKADFIRQLQAEGKKVAMVGDGINDSAALAVADLSIAMGSGSDIAMDVAQVTLLSSDLTKIAEALRLSALTVRTLRQNLFWAFIYNVIAIPVAAGILYPLCGFLLSPMIAGAAMAMSSVSVVTNSLRLRAKSCL